MKNFVIWVAVNAIALIVAAWILPGITLTSPGASDTDKVVTVIVVAVIFGVVNGIIGTILKVLAFPFIIISLGLAIFVINALMLMLTSKIAGDLDVAFHVDEFWWTAIWGALIISLTSAVLSAVKPAG